MQRGLSLVEVLVALVVLQVGLLGIAGLLVEGLRASRMALLHTQAVHLAADMAERIRANPAARAAHAASSYVPAPARHDCVPSTGTPGRSCSEAQLAEDELARWREAVGRALPPPSDPAAAARVEFEPGAGADLPDRYTIRIVWQGPGAEQREVGTSLVMLPALPP